MKTINPIKIKYSKTMLIPEFIYFYIPLFNCWLFPSAYLISWLCQKDDNGGIAASQHGVIYTLCGMGRG